MIISPETTVAALLEAFPQLEDMLITMSPALAKLKNPALRDTIAKVATLRQVAEMGGLPVAELVNTLRVGAGQDAEPAGPDAAASQDDAPSWVRSGTMSVRYDARADLAAGVHPAQRVIGELQALGDGELYELVTPFVPAPLVDMAKSKGFVAWSKKVSASEVRTVFGRKKKLTGSGDRRQVNADLRPSTFPCHSLSQTDGARWSGIVSDIKERAEELRSKKGEIIPRNTVEMMQATRNAETAASSGLPFRLPMG
ncbi:MAG: DUF1858 domain-containing protein [Ignavibacteria bacterium]|nr:DUF1858 domain-containing protein [Ignavibacteria bacterium]